MAQFDIPISMPGGFQSLADAKAHRSVIAKLQHSLDIAQELSADLRSIDKADLGPATPSELYKDLAPGKGHVIMLTQPENAPLMGAELRYDVESQETRSLVLDFSGSKLTQVGTTYKLEEPSATTYFRLNSQQGVFTVLDADQEVPRLFEGADPKKLVGDTLQTSKPLVIF